nr:MAG: replication initiator protein [Microvirus sp.]
MPCYHPISAWQLLNVRTANGKPTLSFKNPFAKPTKDRVAIQVPCGQCIGCRLERSRQWAIRCVHEAKSHEDNCFITLTYDNKHLPVNRSLDKSHFQKFMKRFRKFLNENIWVPKQKKFMRRHEVTRYLAPKVRFFHCGEYGEKNSRPHYHACVFGYDFPDKELYTVRDGVKLYKSETLKKIWNMGFVTVGAVTFESAAYVARYVTKKITGKAAEKHYDRSVNGEGFVLLRKLTPEYVTMSRRGGIGEKWIEEYEDDVYPADEIVLRGKKMRPPRYYDKKFAVDNVDCMDKIKSKRKAKALELAADNTAARLKAKETCKLASFKLLKRGLENEV